MAKAYVLIKTSVGDTQRVLERLGGHEQVKSAKKVLGPYDIIAVVEGADLNSIGILVMRLWDESIDFERTFTCPVIEMQGDMKWQHKAKRTYSARLGS